MRQTQRIDLLVPLLHLNRLIRSITQIHCILWMLCFTLPVNSHAETSTLTLRSSLHESSLCKKLRHILSKPEVTLDQISAQFSPSERLRWRYRKARKLLFSKVAPRHINGDLVIEALYTGRRAHPRHTKSPSGFNCEHLWPRAWMSAKRSSAYRRQEADLHNLYPSEMKVNSRRGHLAFGEVVQTKYQAASPSKIGDDIRGVEVVEIRDEYKGDVARSLLYMAARWRLSFPSMQRLDLLASWSAKDPPSEVEQRRNQQISELQKNRNLFVDCPQLTGVLVKRLKRAREHIITPKNHSSRSRRR
jgi:deoxyribonuclease-1